MGTDSIKEKMSIIMTSEELDRIKIEEDGDDLDITVDLHGLSCIEAKRFMNNIICLVKHNFIFTIIHGYNHGTAIKNMIWEKFINPRVKNKETDTHNPGLTYLSVMYA